MSNDDLAGVFAPAQKPLPKDNTGVEYRRPRWGALCISCGESFVWRTKDRAVLSQGEHIEETKHRVEVRAVTHV